MSLQMAAVRLDPHGKNVFTSSFYRSGISEVEEILINRVNELEASLKIKQVYIERIRVLLKSFILQKLLVL